MAPPRPRTGLSPWPRKRPRGGQRAPARRSSYLGVGSARVVAADEHSRAVGTGRRRRSSA
eukprot:scaffold6166_cov350-Prasinococcus_capsulatus_cf.AAC.3